MSSATLNGVGSVPKSSSRSKIINLVSDDDDDNEVSEIEDKALPSLIIHEISRDSSRGIMSHHQNVGQPEVNVAAAALTPNEMSSEGEFDDEDDDDDEDDSLLEYLLEGLTDKDLYDDPSDRERCTREEGEDYRRQLRTLGPREFCKLTVESGNITAKKLLTAFLIRCPPYLEGEPDEAYYPLLSFALRRELQKRSKLPQHNTVEDAVRLIRKSKKIIVLTGAGISTSLGIPDFRSADGLYAKLKDQGLAVSEPMDVFNIDVFKQDPTIFFSVAKDILPSIVRYTPTHKFIWLLQNKDKLLTNYTQNIDNIESAAGIRPEKLIQCHGSFATATCQKCRIKVDGKEIFDEIKAGAIPRCKQCLVSAPVRSTDNLKRKRSSKAGDKKRHRFSSSDENEDDNIPEAGIMKPDITFFGESLPDRFSDRLSKSDKEEVDLVITIGTSLKVAPVSEVVPYLPSHVPQIQINRDPVSHVEFDIDLLGECDVVVSELCKALGWNLEHEMIPKDQKIEIATVPGYPHRHTFKRLSEDILEAQ